MQRNTVMRIGVGQTIAWAASYYLPAILAAPMAGEFGIAPSAVFFWFSAALVLSALLGPAVGRAIDLRGGRVVLAGSSVVLAAGLGLLAVATGPLGMAAGWAVLGVGMAMGLYDAAFAALAGLFGREARGAITGVTLIAGFASTVGWPATALLEDALGWRGACLVWAALQLGVALPLHLGLARGGPVAVAAVGEAPADRRALGVLAGVFAAAWFVTGAMAAHLPALLLAAGVGSAAMLVGPAQVGARLIEFGLLRRFHPLVSARLAALGHPIGALALVLAGAPGAVAFAVLHGMGNGLLTIARGAVPLALFGPAGYGARQGWVSAPARLLQAFAPFLFGLVLEGWGVSAALALTAGLSLLAFSGLALLTRMDGGSGGSPLPRPTRA